ncbi:MAG: EAL domain-containing protein [Lachnospiraceae bacterium]|nr:EAL domain-containing protein [Lachnospiraceae bacterium]
MEKQLDVRAIFQDAIEKEEFLVYYQPKTELERYQLHGAEALCRWKHEGELISPYRFIPILEEGQEICTLDYYMLEHVCRNIRYWMDRKLPVVRISMNLSRPHISEEGLLEKLISIVDLYHVPHEYMEFELTETMMEVDENKLRELVTGLNKAGFGTSVDDFGVGYSSMDLLQKMPWKVLKIDRSFIPMGKDKKEDERKTIMVRTLLDMARGLGMETIAEGIETIEHVQLLKENRCFMAQGYLFDKPLPANEFEERLKELAG